MASTHKLKKQIRAFLWIVGFNRRFVPDFATIAAPLTELTRAKAPNMVKWTEEMEKAFKTLGSILCGGPVLIVPDFNNRFVLQTDASNVGLGAVYIG